LPPRTFIASPATTRARAVSQYFARGVTMRISARSSVEPASATVEHGGGVEDDRAAGLGVEEHLEQVAPELRQLEQRAAEGGAAPRVDDRLQHAAPLGRSRPPAVRLVVRAQHRRVAVGHGGQRVELATRHLAHRGQVGARALEGLGPHDHRADEGEIGIGETEVRPARGRHAVGGRRRHRESILHRRPA
jgi:hypothetical protein